MAVAESKARLAPEPLEDRLNDNGLRGFVGYNMRCAYLTIHDDLVRNLEQVGLRTTSFSALTLIVDNPDIIQSRLADALRMKRSNLVVVIDELEQRELITRGTVKNDRRAYALRATLKGRRLRDKAVKAVAAHEDRLLASLNIEQRKWLVEILNRIEA
jgi:DNA-binding MarR family transcriptional regulator